MAKTNAKKAAKAVNIDNIIVTDKFGSETSAKAFYAGGVLGTSCLRWEDAWKFLKAGVPVKRVSWMGYWAMENNRLVMHCKDGTLVTLDKCDEPFTLANIAESDWVPVTQGMKNNLDAVHKARCLEYKKGK